MKLKEDKVHKGMWRLEWPDGVLSKDFYNLTRAHDILQNYEEYVKYMEMRGEDPRKHTLFSPLDGP